MVTAASAVKVGAHGRPTTVTTLSTVSVGTSVFRKEEVMS
jgi:hypothetical protein